MHTYMHAYEQVVPMSFRHIHNHNFTTTTASTITTTITNHHLRHLEQQLPIPLYARAGQGDGNIHFTGLAWYELHISSFDQCVFIFFVVALCISTFVEAVEVFAAHIWFRTFFAET